MVEKKFKKPNVKGPRFRQEMFTIVDRSFIDNLKKKYPKYSKLSEADVRKIIKVFNETFWKEVIETRDGVELPEGLGQVFIATCRNPKRENIDFAKSNKYGILITNKNWDTDGRLAKIFYTSYSTKYKFVNRECWEFIACRNFKRTVAKTYPENWNMYVQIDPDRKLRSVYRKGVLSMIHKKRLETKLKDYNEFDL